ncbi:hypothetical protein AC52_2163 [Escherichia coli 5-366-08_S3_C3]|nr:hypothetical protein AB72_2548 [Escherichia coli 1-250-04_S1_C3]KDX26059.1 hypothetical protein AB41_4260 [Escherichia coli 1-250-04_S1_C2]KDX28384.1 hypothetical protein AB13_3617 [Escherichia coli 1-250-04_S1_C1]KEL75175.1 hypothetical protein AC52_2163 [Escherichia coli 5-366-08_S3_C3]KEL89482.1 hypothetical protein AB94_4456 [Escherichia coli 5-366-08_S3_C1]
MSINKHKKLRIVNNNSMPCWWFFCGENICTFLFTDEK